MGHAQRKAREAFDRTVIKLRQELEGLEDLKGNVGVIRSVLSLTPSRLINEWDTGVGAYWAYKHVGAGRPREKATIYIINTPRVGNAERVGTARVWGSDLGNSLASAEQNVINSLPRIEAIKSQLACLVHPDTKNKIISDYGALAVIVTGDFIKTDDQSSSDISNLHGSAISKINSARTDLVEYGLTASPKTCTYIVPKENPMDIAYTHNALMDILDKPTKFPTVDEINLKVDLALSENWNQGLISEFSESDLERRRIQNVIGGLRGAGVGVGTYLIDINKLYNEKQERLRKEQAEKNRILEEQRIKALEEEQKRILATNIKNEAERIKMLELLKVEAQVKKEDPDIIKKTTGVSLLVAGAGLLVWGLLKK
jgi:hypothetical protein